MASASRSSEPADPLPLPSERTPAPQPERAGIALCLSGGGYRAALFHLGLLRRLDELGTLPRVDTISSVSGGSIVAGFLAQRLAPWPTAGRDPRFDGVADAVREFTRKNIRTAWFARRILPWNWTDSTVAVETLTARYEKDVVRLRLAELPERPRFVFCATDMSFGINWVFERSRVGSYMPGYVSPPPNWSVARAIAASSCFPPVFEPMPVQLDPRAFRGGIVPQDDPDREELIRGLRLTDGGLYDNMALEPAWKRHAVLLVSDGGATFDHKPPASMLRPVKHLGRYLEVQGGQAGAMRRRWLNSSFGRKEMRGVYLRIGSHVDNFVPGAPGYEHHLVNKIIREVRTDLDYFSDAEAAALENHGYLLADAAMQKYGRDWIDASPAPARIPHPDWMDAEKLGRAMKTSSKRTAGGRPVASGSRHP